MTTDECNQKRRQPRHRDGGFTLIELLITIAIMGVITLPLGNLVISYFKNTANTTARLAGSHDAQIAAAYFSQDVASLGVQSAGAPATSLWVTPFGGAPACGSAVAGGTRILIMASDDYSTATAGSFSTTTTPQIVNIAYVATSVGTVSQPRYELHRVRCVGTASSGSDATLMHNLVAIPAVPICDITAATACSSSTPYPGQVQMNLVIMDTSSPSATYSVALSGQRRQT